MRRRTSSGQQEEPTTGWRGGVGGGATEMVRSVGVCVRRDTLFPATGSRYAALTCRETRVS